MFPYVQHRYPLASRLTLLLGCLATICVALATQAYSLGSLGTGSACAAPARCGAAAAAAGYLVGALLALLFAAGCAALLSALRKPLIDCAAMAAQLSHSHGAADDDGGAQGEFIAVRDCMTQLSERLGACTLERDQLRGRIQEQDRLVTQSFDFIYRVCAGVTRDGASSQWLSTILDELLLYTSGSCCAVWLVDGVALETNLPALVRAGEGDLDMGPRDIKELASRPGVQRIFPDDDGGELRLTVALHDGGEIYGVLLVESQPGNLLHSRHFRLLESVGGLLSLSIGSLLRNRRRRRLALIDERHAIAGELHDSLAQTLSFIKIQMSILHREISRAPQLQDALSPICGEIRAGLDAAYRHLRELLTAFRTDMPSGGLHQAVQQMLDELAGRSPLNIELDYRLDDVDLSVHQEFNVLQVVREAVTNTIRHARASQVLVRLHHDRNGEAAVDVDDDGRGLSDPGGKEGHHGLAIMRERARQLGGALDIGARAPTLNGTRVALRFPLVPPH